MSYPKRIIVSPLRFIGDGILIVPFLRKLRLLYPDARIELLLSSHMVNLFELCPYINEIVVRPKSKKELYGLIKSRSYNLGFLFRKSVTEAFILKQSGVKKLVGYDEQRFIRPLSFRRWGWFLDEAIRFPELNTDIPQVKTCLSLLGPFDNLEYTDESLELWADEEDKLKVAAIFNANNIESSKPIAIIHGTSDSREKALAADKFVPALQAMQKHDIQVISIGTNNDREFYNTLANRAQTSIFNLCGDTTLRQSFALMLQVQLILSLDSAPVHMAAAAGIPSIIGIYGPTNEKQWCPYPYEGLFTPVFNRKLNCRPCLTKICQHNSCRTDLESSDITEAVNFHINTLVFKSRV